MPLYDLYKLSTHDPGFTGSYTLEDTTPPSGRYRSDYQDNADDDLSLYGDIPNDRFDTNYLEYRGLAADSGGTDIGFLIQSTVSSSVYLVVPSGTSVTSTGTSTPVDPDDPNTQWDAVNDVPACFMADTRIATPNGSTPVQSLAIGDEILTSDGGTTQVKWIGRHTVHKTFTPAEIFAPVRIRAGALGDDLPETDLRLTADHALVIDDLAINAGALVNGTTITFDALQMLPERLTYFHVETAGHAAILANGAPAETFIDYRSRRMFDNFAEYLELYGEETTIQEMDLPRISSARLVPAALKARLAGQKVA